MAIKSLKPILLIIFVGTILRAPLYKTPWWRTNDAFEYVDVARNIADGKGLIQQIKFRLHDPTPVVTSALRTRPPLTSLIYALLLKINRDVYFLQIFSFVLGLLNAILVYLLALNFVPMSIALLGGLLAVSNPNILITSRLILSDQLFAAFPLLAANFLYAVKKENLKASLLGICSGLLVLTRLEGILLFLLLLIWSRKKRKTFALILIFFLIVTVPYFWVNSQANGSPMFTTNAIHYSVFDIRDALEGGFERSFPKPLAFISQNLSWVVTHLASVICLNFASLAEFGYFGPLIILLLLSLRQNWKKYLLWLVFSLVVILQYSTLWSGTFEKSRHFIYLYLLLLPLILDFLNRHKKNLLIWAMVLVTLFGYFALDWHRIFWARTIDPNVSVWDQSSKAEIFDWIRNNTQNNAIIASTNPFMIDFQTQRPSITIPTNLTTSNFPRFIKKYGVSYLLITKGERSDYLTGREILKSTFSDGRIYQVGE